MPTWWLLDGPKFRFFDSDPSWVFNYDLFRGSNSCIMSLPLYMNFMYTQIETIFLEIIIVIVIIITIVVIITDNVSTNCKIQKMFFRMSHNIFECFMKNWIIEWGFIWQISFFYSFLTEHQLTSSFHPKQWLGRDGYRRYSWLKLCNWRKINMT